MKRIYCLALSILTIILATCCLFSCVPGAGGVDGDDSEWAQQPEGDKPGDKVSMIAEVTALGDKITVEVIESEYTYGPHWVITAPTTEYLGKDGGGISRSDIKVGDKVKILYSGQVMMSLPPQIVAAKISVVG